MQTRCFDEFIGFRNTNNVTKVDRFSDNVEKSEPRLDDRFRAHFIDDGVNVAGHIGVVCLGESEVFGLLTRLGPPDQLEQSIGQGIAHTDSIR